MQSRDKITEGPWQSQHDLDIDGLRTIVGGIDGPDDGQYHFTVVCELNDEAPEFERNRRLVIAAPEISDALAGLVGLTQLLLGRDDLPAQVREALQSNHRVVTARAAIAKATGA